MTKEEEFNFNDTKDDELVVLRIPRDEAKILRQMAKERQSAGVIFKKTTTVIFALAGGLLAIYEFGSVIKKGFLSLIGVS